MRGREIVGRALERRRQALAAPRQPSDGARAGVAGAAAAWTALGAAGATSLAAIAAVCCAVPFIGWFVGLPIVLMLGMMGACVWMLGYGFIGLAWLGTMVLRELERRRGEES